MDAPFLNCRVNCVFPEMWRNAPMNFIVKAIPLNTSSNRIGDVVKNLTKTFEFFLREGFYDVCGNFNDGIRLLHHGVTVDFF